MDNHILTKRGISLQKLRIFLTVADEAKFSKAGEQLGITQPAVSLQIKEFENSWALPFSSEFQQG